MYILVKVYNYTAVVVMDGRWVVDHLVIDAAPRDPQPSGAPSVFVFVPLV